MGKVTYPYLSQKRHESMGKVTYPYLSQKRHESMGKVTYPYLFQKRHESMGKETYTYPEKARAPMKRDLHIWKEWKETYIYDISLSPEKEKARAPTQRPNSRSLFIYVGLFSHRFRSLLREHLLQLNDQTQNVHVLQLRLRFECSIHMQVSLHMRRSLSP